MQDNKMSLRIGDIFYTLLKKKRLIALLALLGMLVGVLLSAFSYVRGEMAREYRIVSSVAISAQNEQDAYASSYKDDMMLAEYMTDSVMYIMRSDTTVKATIEQLDIDGVTVRNIQNNLTLRRHNDTQIIELSLLWRSGEEGKQILEALTVTSNEVLKDKLDGIGQLKQIDEPSASYIFGGSINFSTWVYSAAVGVIVGIALCVIRLIARPTLIRVKDAQTLFGAEVIGALPFAAEYEDSDPYNIRPESVNREIEATADILMNRLQRAKVRTVYVTSTKAGEGKTRLIADLGAKIAKTGKTVLLIDCNFREPALASAFGKKVKKGCTLNALYKGDCNPSDAVIRLADGLSLLPCVAAKDFETINDEMLAVIRRVCEGYDCVLIDTCAISESSQAIRLNEVAGAAVYVIRFDDAKLADVKKSLLKLSKSGIPVAGFIVNETKTYRDVLRPFRKKAKKTKKKSEQQ